MATHRSRAFRLHTESESEDERKITWLELFYDLIYVASIIQLGDLLSEDVSVRGALLFTLLFIPIWWSWTGMMFYFNRFVVTDVWHRLLVFAQMFAVANLAISVTGAFGESSQAFALAYFAVRAILVLFYLRAWRHVPNARPLIARYLTGFSVAAAVWLLSAFVPPPYRYALWVLGLAIEFYTSVAPATRRRQSLLPPDAPHLAERFGLFTIIVLGESFIKVVGGLADHGATASSLLFGGLGFAITASLWWLYFDTIHGAPLRRAPYAPYVWIYAHLPLTLGLTAVGVGAKKLSLIEIGYALPASYRWLLCGALLVSLLALGTLARLRATRPPTVVASLLPAAALAVVLGVALFGGLLSAVWAALLLALACAAQALAGRLAGPAAHDPHAAFFEPPGEAGS